MIYRHFKRSLRRPLFATVITVTLAMVIGISTTAFHLAGSVLFSNAPFHESSRMVRLWDYTKDSDTRYFSFKQLDAIRQRCDAFEAVVSCRWRSNAFPIPGSPAERLWALNVTPEFFEVFRVQPTQGRIFTRDEYTRGNTNVAILTHRLWRTHFHSDPQVIGTSVRLNDESVQIVGVMPETFDYRPVWEVKMDLLRPESMSQYATENEAQRYFQAVARLRPSMTVMQAQSQIETVVSQMADKLPAIYGGHRVQVRMLNETLISRTDRRASILLSVLALLVLVIGCVNLANLHLVRISQEYGNMVVKTALGATRRHLVIDQTTNVLVGSIPGCILGLVLAYWLATLVSRSPAVGEELNVGGHFTVSIVLWTLIVVLITVLASGVLPAVFTSNIDIASSLRTRGQGGDSGRRQRNWQSVLIMFELGFAMILLSSANAIAMGLNAYTTRDHGWRSDGLLFATFRAVQINRYKDESNLRTLHRNLQQHFEEIPSVQGVALSTSVPIAFNTSELPISGNDVTAQPDNLPLVAVSRVTASYFDVMGIPFRQGSSFPNGIKQTDSSLVVVSESVANRYWPGENAVGRRLVTYEGKMAKQHQVVGVVGNVQLVANWTSTNNDLRVYMPLILEPWAYFNAVLRGQDIAQMRKGILQISAAIDPDVIVEEVQTTDEAIILFQPRILLMRRTLQWFAIVGLVLAAGGLFGVVSFVLHRRSHEFSLRMALGASMGSLLTLVFRWILWLLALGSIVGVVGSILVVSAIIKILPVISHGALYAVPLSILTLGLAGVVAALIPALRAVRADPAALLRSE